MKVIVDGRPIRDPISGVAETVINLVKNLETNVDVSIFLQSNLDKNSIFEKYDFLNKIICNHPSFLTNISFEFNINTKFLRHKNIIFHETYFARLPITRNTNKLVSTIHDVIPLDFPDWFSWRNAYFSKRNFFRQMNHSNIVCFPSSYSATRAQEIYGKEITHKIIPWGISSSIRQKFNSYVPNHKEEFILILGNIEPRKNIIFICKAVNIFNKRFGQNIKVLIAGRKIYKADEILNDCHKVNDNLKYLGYISQHDKIKLLQEAAAVVYASKYEGFGLPILESAIIGSPVLIANNSCLKEVAPHNNYLFESDNIDSLVECLEKMIFKGVHTIIGKANHHKIYLESDWQKCATRYIDVYKNINDTHC